jgi:hypothetical protein
MQVLGLLLTMFLNGKVGNLNIEITLCYFTKS